MVDVTSLPGNTFEKKDKEQRSASYRDCGLIIKRTMSKSVCAITREMEHDDRH
jgi:hypothetical protein